MSDSEISELSEQLFKSLKGRSIDEDNLIKIKIILSII